MDIKNLHLHKVATVVINSIHDGYDNGYHHKFIVAKVTDSKGNMKRVVRASNKGKGYGHYQIFYALQQEVMSSGLTVECIGGGTLDTDSKSWISIYGSSESYGREPDRKQTVCILKKEYPNFKVNIENS